LRLVNFIDPENSALRQEEMLEIETKAGRFYHLRPVDRCGSIALQPGPARSQGGEPRDPVCPQGLQRTWRDLSESLAGAFDGRPTVLSLEPTRVTQGVKREGAAEEWVLQLSTGYRITCRQAGERLELTGEYLK
jgi:hypothetical protein